MGESSKFPKSWTLETPILNLAVCPLNIHNFKFKWSDWKKNQESCYGLPNLAFWGFSVESQPQNPENFHPW